MRKGISGRQQRQVLAEGIGRAMLRAGVRVGRKPIQADHLPNRDNYRAAMRGMGMGIVKTKGR